MRTPLSGRWVFVDPPAPAGFVSFKHSHGGFGESCRTSRLRLPTLDLFHCASLLAAHGRDVGVVDATLQGLSPEGCAREVLARKPAVVAVRTSGFTLPIDLEVASALRRSFGGPLVFFGPAAAALAAEILASGSADAVAAGEVPLSLLEACVRGALRGVPGILTRGKAGGVEGRPRPWPRRMDHLPTPSWDLVDYRRYSFVTSQTSWGCPRDCGYCPYPLSQGRVLRSRRGLRFVQLRDPDFCSDRRRAEALCRALVRGGAAMTWGCETRLERLDPPLMDLMAEAGCLRVEFGVESLSPSALRAMGRRPVPQGFIRERVRELKRRGILTYGLYMIGLPGETRESTLELIDFALSLGTEAASFSMAMPFPGTRLHRLAESRGWIAAPGPWGLTNCVASMRNGAMDLDEVSELHCLAKKRWKERDKASAACAP
ncbi:MAG: radical SAM protein [Elusimicrobiota bacterium]